MNKHVARFMIGAYGVTLTYTNASAQPAPRETVPENVMRPLRPREKTVAPVDIRNRPKAVNYTTVAVYNLNASLLAWWLDPTHNDEPDELKGARPLDNRIGPNRPAPFQLPVGVLQIVPLYANNSLLIIGGSAEDVATTRDIVSVLDRPLRQVEIETQFLQIDNQNLTQLGFSPPQVEEPQMDEPAAEKPLAPLIRFVPADVRTRIATLTLAGKVQVLSSSQLMAINNVIASAGMSIGRTTAMGYKDENGAFQGIESFLAPKQNENGIQVPAQAAKLLDVNLSTTTNFSVTPTINADNTMTLLISSSRTLELASEAHTVPLAELDQSQTIANLKDGDTIALSGLPANSFNPMDKAKGMHDKTFVLLVTARIVRRAGDE